MEAKEEGCPVVAGHKEIKGPTLIAANQRRSPLVQDIKDCVPVSGGPVMKISYEGCFQVWLNTVRTVS